MKIHVDANKNATLKTMSQRRNQQKSEYLRTNTHGQITFQNIWATAEDILRGKTIVIKPSPRKREKKKKKSSNT